MVVLNMLTRTKAFKKTTSQLLSEAGNDKQFQMFAFFSLLLLSAEKNAFAVEGGGCRLPCGFGEGSVHL